MRPSLRKHESFVILGICACGWLAAIPMIYDGGVYLYTLMDWNTASWAILLIGIAEVGIPAWCYGCNKFLDNIEEMKMSLSCVVRYYWWFSWMILAPITALVSTWSSIFNQQFNMYLIAKHKYLLKLNVYILILFDFYVRHHLHIFMTMTKSEFTLIKNLSIDGN